MESPSCLKNCEIIKNCTETVENLTEPLIPISTIFDPNVYDTQCQAILTTVRQDAEASGLLDRFHDEVSFIGCLDSLQLG